MRAVVLSDSSFALVGSRPRITSTDPSGAGLTSRTSPTTMPRAFTSAFAGSALPVESVSRVTSVKSWKVLLNLVMVAVRNSATTRKKTKPSSLRRRTGIR